MAHDGFREQRRLRTSLADDGPLESLRGWVLQTYFWRFIEVLGRFRSRGGPGGSLWVGMKMGVHDEMRERHVRQIRWSKTSCTLIFRDAPTR